MKTIILHFVLAALVYPALCAADQQREFDQPEKAAEALFHAAESQNVPALEGIFGKTFFKKINSGDPVLDRARISGFAKRYSEAHTIEDGAYGSKRLVIGADHWPFPVPLTRRDERWVFNATLGAQEISNRRIGENEIQAIKGAHFFSDAQQLYHQKDRTGKGLSYARRFVSTPGKQDGLYWPITAHSVSPFEPIAARIRNEGYALQVTELQPIYQGYRYKILTAQGANAPGGAKSYLSRGGEMTEGFAMIAYPVRWGVGGVMSFIVGSDGTVYEKDLGSETARIASALQTFNPDSSWRLVKE